MRPPQISQSHVHHHNPNRPTHSVPYLHTSYLWKPPPHGHIKINLDANWAIDTHLVGLGVIARDCRSKMIDGVHSIGQAFSAHEAEARAAILACNLAEKLSPVPIIIESDSKCLIDAINSPSTCKIWSIYPAVAKIKNSPSFWQRIAWSWVSRKANSAADHLASLAVRRMCPDVWIDRPPSSLVGILSRDGLPCPPSS
ncbi:uncharacterized protein LOC133716370 [Rosa rugosa]|uniref:uncharacterized protein LOC133716370 n=1 Tax=Rosa rugosa TaxID=74645 RepID=UPI002B40148A|nr:uncharacterized protein LOC133716370 [Rosa rugosa]